MRESPGSSLRTPIALGSRRFLGFLGRMPPTTSGKGHRLKFDIDLGSATSQGGKRRANAPLQILIAADCSGRAGRGISAPLAGRRTQRLSVDHLDKVFAAWNAQIQTAVRLASGAAVSLHPRSLEDLHPDELLRAVAPLAEILELRGEVDDPRAAERLVALLASTSGARGTSATTPSDSPSSGAAAAPSGAAGDAEREADTLSRLLGAPPRGASSERRTNDAPTARVDVGRFIRDLVGDSATPAPGPGAASRALTAAADLELARLLRALLRDPHFRSLEATWRGLDQLCRNCPDDELVRYQVVDATATEILTEVGATHALLEAQRTSILLLDHYFGATAAELGALAQLLRTCAAHQVILVTGASPELAGYAGFAAAEPSPTESALPEAAAAAWRDVTAARSDGAQLALVLPRCLLRQPYGKTGQPLESLAFEELVDPADHEAFCWGNGAYLAARALSVRHAGDGGTVQLDGSVELREMPVIRLRDDDGFRLQPSAETWLSERWVERLRAAGFAVLQGVRDSDRIRVHV